MVSPPPVSRFVFTSRANQRRVSLHPPPPVDVCHNILILNRVTDQPCVRIIRRYSVAVYIRAYCKSTRRGTWPRVNTSNRGGGTKERVLSRVRARKDERGEGVLVTPSHSSTVVKCGIQITPKSPYFPPPFSITRPRTRSP